MSKRFSKIVAAIIVALCILPYSKVYGAPPRTIDVYINEERVVSDVEPVLEKGRVLVPLRVISEYLGAQVHWDDESKAVTLKMGSSYIELVSDDNKAFIDGEKVILDVPAKIIQGRILVPLRFIGEGLGAEVYWDDENKRVNIVQVQIKVTQIHYDFSPGSPVLTIEGDGPLQYDLWCPEEEGPLILDVLAALDAPQNALYTYDDFVEKVIVGQAPDNPNMLRFVVDLRGKSTYEDEVFNGGKAIAISFHNTLNTVEVEEGEDSLIARLATSTSNPISSSFLPNPDRLVIDMDNTLLATEVSDIQENNFLQGIRLGQFSISPNITRVVFDLKENSNYQVFQSGEVINVYFSPVSILSNLKVSSENTKSTVRFRADRDIGYEVKADEANKLLRITVSGVDLGKGFDDFIDVGDGIIDSIKVVKTREHNSYNVTVDIKLNSSSGFELVTTPPSKEVELTIHKSVLHNKIIAVDPGHGGDPGAIVQNVEEKILNLGIALKLKDLLEAQGAKVVMIRDRDMAVDQYVRAGIANQAGSDAFISIHHNSAPNTAVTGTETWYYPDQDKKAFAQAIQNAVIDATGNNNRGIKESVGLIVTRETRMPSALVEVAFMTNPQDLAKAQNQDFQQTVALGILQGIVSFFSGH